MSTSPRTLLRIHFHLPEPDLDLYEELLDVLADVTPQVEAHPADFSAAADLTGALRYWGQDAAGLIGVIRLRALALHGVPTSAGAGPSRMIAAMAAALTPAGGATIVANTPYDISAFLRPQPATALPGIGPAATRTLARLGIGDIADTPLATLQRILGVAAGRQAHDRALGIDDRPIVPAAAPRSLALSHRFDHDELDPDQHHRAVLGLTEQIGAALRDDRQVAHGLTLTATYADRSHASRTRSLAEATAHTPALTATARELLTSLGLQRARVRSLSLRAERLQPAETAIHQLTLGTDDERARDLEASGAGATVRRSSRYASKAGASSAGREAGAAWMAATAPMRRRGAVGRVQLFGRGMCSISREREVSSTLRRRGRAGLCGELHLLALLKLAEALGSDVGVVGEGVLPARPDAAELWTGPAREAVAR